MSQKLKINKIGSKNLELKNQKKKPREHKNMKKLMDKNVEGRSLL